MIQKKKKKNKDVFTVCVHVFIYVGLYTSQQKQILNNQCILMDGIWEHLSFIATLWIWNFTVKRINTFLSKDTADQVKKQMTDW